MRPGRKCSQAWSGRVELRAEQAWGCSWAETALFLKDKQPGSPKMLTVAALRQNRTGGSASDDGIMASYPVSAAD